MKQERQNAHHFWRTPELVFAESRCARNSFTCYAPHTHPVFSVGVIDGGSSAFVSGNQLRRLGRGDEVMIPPGEVHACNPEKGTGWSYQMLYLDECWLRGVVAELTQNDAITLMDAHRWHPPRFIHCALSALNRILFSPTSWQDKEAALVNFAGSVFSPTSPKSRTDSGEHAPGKLDHVKSMISERCAEALPLACLAAEANMSRYHFVRAFRKTTGMTPHAWQLDARIINARTFLAQGLPLAETALRLGFADQSHFQKVFKQRVAATPSQYQRNFLQDFVT